MRRAFTFAALPLVLASCARIGEVSDAPRSGAVLSGAPSDNLSDACVGNFDPTIDYFPAKTAVRHAAQFRVTYHKHYKLITFEPTVYTQETIQYLLVQCGAPVPTGYSNARVIQIPVRRFVLNHAGFISCVVRLGIADRLIGVNSMLGVSHPEIISRFERGLVQEVGSASHSNVEKTMALDPDVLMTFYSAYPNFNTHPKLWEVGIQAVPLADHFELTPLGRAEWIKFIAALFNRERETEEIFAPAEMRYLALKEKTRGVLERPQVLLGWSWARDIWSLSGGRNFMARMIEDAGGQYFWNDDLAWSLIQASYERVFDRQADTSVWLGRGFMPGSRSAMIASDSRARFLSPIERDGVYSSDKKTSVHRRAPFNDQSLDQPEVVLADIIRILHPDRLPDHDPVFFRKLN